MSNTFTTTLSDSQTAALKGILEARGYEPRSVPYSRYSYAGHKVVVTVYEKNNKLLVQGAGQKDFIEFILEPEVLGETMFGSKNDECAEATGFFRPHFGIDESGKGDVFGPLVIAGVYADSAIASSLLKLGVCDSKMISSSSKIKTLAAGIRKTPGIAFEVIRIGPERYNEMYAGFNNLNRLLAWGHARVIEALMQKVPGCRHALSDQFARESVLQAAMKHKKLDIELEQRTKAESDIAVAAASILARERFVNWMEEASDKSGIPLPFGASKKVIEAGREMVGKYGEAILPKIAKMHFRTIHEILS